MQGGGAAGFRTSRLASSVAFPKKRARYLSSRRSKHIRSARSGKLAWPKARDLATWGNLRAHFLCLAISDERSRDQACETIVSSCQIGGQLVEGRRRPSGKRSSPSLRPELYAPAPSRNFLRREAERNFVERFQLLGQEYGQETAPHSAPR